MMEQLKYVDVLSKLTVTEIFKKICTPPELRCSQISTEANTRIGCLVSVANIN